MPTKNNRLHQQTDLGVRLVELKSLALKILSVEPKNTDALNSLGLISMQLELFDEAVSFFEQAHHILPDRQDYIDNLIKCLEFYSKNMCGLGRLSVSIEMLERALILSPDNAAITCRLSYVLGLENRNEEALLASEQALLSDPKFVQAYEARGLALLGLNRINPAIKSLKRALEYNEISASAHTNLGLAYRAKGETKGAIDCFKKAISIDENNTQAYNNLGVSFLDSNKLEQAEEALRDAVAIDQDFAEAHFNLSRVMLMAENFKAGWKHNEWRWLCSTFPSTWREFPQSMWQGEDLRNKKILVWSEQGIGDEIMFANTLPELIKNSGRVVMECSDRLVPVFKRSFEGVHAFARQDPPNSEIKTINADVQIPLGSICNFYRKKAEDFPAVLGGYLKSDPKLTSKIKSHYSSLGSGIKVGISWKSGNPIVGHERSIPIEFWHEIFTLRGCHFINLQYGEFEEDLKRVFETTGVSIFQDNSINPINNAEDWFSQIGALDHVISVDNSTIQVSGSLGVPTWVLLSSTPEWRFGLNRSDHLWHPSVRVYRQRKKGEWGPLMKEVALAFASFIKR